MHADRFDALLRSFNRPASRRRVFGGLPWLLAALPGVGSLAPLLDESLAARRRRKNRRQGKRHDKRTAKPPEAGRPNGGSSTLVVQTPSGALRGVTDGTVTSWRGVPYAASPVGELRWRPPAPVTPWKGIRDATQFAPVCPQLDLAQPGQVTGSEDCLYLNVFAPAQPSSKQRLPVMVHLHPGSNILIGPYTNAEAFTARGVVVVTVAYRLGLLGFMGHPALSAEGAGGSGEYALLDQLAALQWVQDSIAAFGGDPTNVTLFGESSGSIDAIALVASPLGHGLFQRAALQTASPQALDGSPIAEAEAIGEETAAALECAAESNVLACLRARSAAQFVLANGLRLFQPWQGGAVLPESAETLIAAQRKTIPLLLGSLREEAAGEIPAAVDGSPYGIPDWERDTDALAGPQHGETLRALYPTERYDAPLWATVTLYTDAIYTCPMRRLALAAQGRVWRYLYVHHLENDPDLARLRAAHSLEDPLLWHDVGLVNLSRLVYGFAPSRYTFSPAEETLSARMTDYWTNFAKTGNPNRPRLPAWPAFAASEKTLVLDTEISQVSVYHREECAFLDTIPAPVPR